MESWDTLYDRILESGPSQGTLLLVLSKLKEEGRISKVIQECLKALRVFPHDLRLRHLLADAYLDSGRLARAEVELSKLAKQIKDLAPVYKQQAGVYARMGRREEAIKAVELYLAYDPEDEDALEVLTTLTIEEQTDEPDMPGTGATVTRGRDAEKEPPPPEETDLTDIATPTIAEVYFNQGLLQEAIDTYERVIARNPDDERSIKRLAELRADKEDEPDSHGQAGEEIRAKREKTVNILQGWLDLMREKQTRPMS